MGICPRNHSQTENRRLEQMHEKKEKLIIQGNELYEIDLDCMKRKQEGKDCWEERRKKEAEKKK